MVILKSRRVLMRKGRIVTRKGRIEGNLGQRGARSRWPRLGEKRGRYVLNYEYDGKRPVLHHG